MKKIILAVMLAGGVASAQGDAPPAQTMTASEVTKWITFFDKLVDTVVKVQTACDKMAVDVNAVVDANKDAIAVAKAAKAQGRKLPPDAQQKMVDGVKKMIPGMQNCGQNEKVRGAFAKLDLNRK
jgi:hypothetical protein